MQVKRPLILILVTFILFAMPGTVLAQGLGGDQVIFGGSYTLSSGETLNGDLVVFGGAANLEPDSLVNGDVVLFGGSIDVDGEIAGDLVALGGAVRLGETGRIQGDLVAPGGSLDRAPGAQVSGEVITGMGPFFTIPFTNRVVVDQTPWGIRFLTGLVWFLFRTFAMAALAVLVVMFAPKHTQRVANSIVDQPIATGGVGLLTTIVAPALFLILAITLILIPVSFLGIVLVGIAAVFGWIALGLEAGERLAKTLNQDWALPVSAGLGTFILTFVVTAIGAIDCVGWIAPALVVVLALGGVILTRFGTRSYPLTSGAVVFAEQHPVPEQPSASPDAEPQDSPGEEG